MIQANRDKEHWNRMSLYNIAAAGYFAADRSIGEYADRIWHLRRIPAPEAAEAAKTKRKPAL